MDKIELRQITYLPKVDRCSIHQDELKSYQTRYVTHISLIYGPEVGKEVFYYCEKCKNINHDGTWIYGPTYLRKLFGYGYKYGYDIELKTGLLRFKEHKNTEDVSEILKKCTFKKIPVRTIVDISKRFLERLKCIHNANPEKIKFIFSQNGGYILHLDGTLNETGIVLFNAKDSLSSITLNSDIIPSENEDNLISFLEDIKAKYGNPLAIIRDMADGVKNASNTVFPGVPQVECHYHVLKAVGKRLLKTLHVDLGNILSKSKIRHKLGELLREVKPKVIDIQGLEDICNHIINRTNGKFTNEILSDNLSPDDIGNVVVYILIDWVLKYNSDAKGVKFPFSLPHLALFTRCSRAKQITTLYRKLFADHLKSHAALAKLEKILFEISDENPNNAKLSAIIFDLIWMNSVFNEIRTIFRLRDNKNILTTDGAIDQESIDKMKETLKKYLKSLSDKIQSLKPKNIRRRGIESTIEFINEHMPYLFIPNLTVDVNGEKQMIFLPRTNNPLEQDFWRIERMLLKLKGRKDVRKTMELYGEGISILLNMDIDTYMDEVFGGKGGILSAMANTPIPKSEYSEKNTIPKSVNKIIRKKTMRFLYSIFVFLISLLGDFVSGLPSGWDDCFKPWNAREVYSYREKDKYLSPTVYRRCSSNISI